jgi:mRNA-degrading endonuclease RelE of RelBE toxin-antitoxin system
MTYNLIVTEEADYETTDAYLYYEEQQEGLGERFLYELNKQYNQLLKNPEYYGYLSGGITDHLRKVQVKDFPFLVIYHIKSDDIIIYSVHNTSKNDKKFL